MRNLVPFSAMSLSNSWPKSKNKHCCYLSLQYVNRVVDLERLKNIAVNTASEELDKLSEREKLLKSSEDRDIKRVYIGLIKIY